MYLQSHSDSLWDRLDTDESVTDPVGPEYLTPKVRED